MNIIENMKCILYTSIEIVHHVDVWEFKKTKKKNISWIVCHTCTISVGIILFYSDYWCFRRLEHKYIRPHKHVMLFFIMQLWNNQCFLFEDLFGYQLRLCVYTKTWFFMMAGMLNQQKHTAYRSRYCSIRCPFVFILSLLVSHTLSGYAVFSLVSFIHRTCKTQHVDYLLINFSYDIYIWTLVPNASPFRAWQYDSDCNKTKNTQFEFISHSLPFCSNKHSQSTGALSNFACMLILKFKIEHM